MLIVKTESGQRVMKDRSVPLSPRQRSAFILVDGKRSLDEVLKATAPMGVTRQDIDHLIALGLVAPLVNGAAPDVSQPAPLEAPAAAPPGAPTAETASAGEGAGRTPQKRYADAYPIASQLTASLGLRGFRLNLAVEGATSYEQLLEVAPRIKDAVGAEKYAPLDKALTGD